MTVWESHATMGAPARIFWGGTSANVSRVSLGTTARRTLMNANPSPANMGEPVTPFRTGMDMNVAVLKERQVRFVSLDYGEAGQLMMGHCRNFVGQPAG